jgi:SAM-dependent methyltransferase
MIDTHTALAINRAGWDRVAPAFHGGTALPEYGPLAATEEALRLLDGTNDLCALELGCGSGHSLRYLAERGAAELWGVDLSPVQIAFARETLRACTARVHLIESPMEVDPGLPQGHFDLVFSIYGVGWTTDLRATMALVARCLRPGGAFIVSGEHPVYACLKWNGADYTLAEPYLAEGPRAYGSWKGVPIVIQRRTLGAFVGEIVGAGLQLEALVEAPLNLAQATDAHADPSRWYSIDRARMIPTTFIIKARKPAHRDGPPA